MFANTVLKDYKHREVNMFLKGNGSLLILRDEFSDPHVLFFPYYMKYIIGFIVVVKYM